MKNNRLNIKQHEHVTILEWVGNIDSSEYRQTFQRFLKSSHSTKTRYWLLDYKKSVGLSQKDRAWVLQEWFPRSLKVIDKGIEKIGIVVPENIFNRVTIRVISTEIQTKRNTVDVAFFGKKEEAIDWLFPENPEGALEYFFK